MTSGIKSGAGVARVGKRKGKRTFEGFSDSVKRRLYFAGLRSYDKAEFINGQIVVESPAMARHIWISGRLAHLLRCYARRFDPEAKVGVEKALVAFPKNAYEPDVCYWKGGKAAAIPETKWRMPVPDFIAEILSKDSLKRDKVVKKRDYERYGVAEYWIIDPVEKSVECYVLDDTKQYTLKPNENIVSISVLPGLAFDKAALFSDTANDEACYALSFPTIYEALEKARAEAEASRIEADASRAEAKSARAEAEFARAETESARAGEEAARAEIIRQKRNFILYLRELKMDES